MNAKEKASSSMMASSEGCRELRAKMLKICKHFPQPTLKEKFMRANAPSPTSTKNRDDSPKKDVQIKSSSG